MQNNYPCLIDTLTTSSSDKQGNVHTTINHTKTTKIIMIVHLSSVHPVLTTTLKIKKKMKKQGGILIPYTQK